MDLMSRACGIRPKDSKYYELFVLSCNQRQARDAFDRAASDAAFSLLRNLVRTVTQAIGSTIGLDQSASIQLLQEMQHVTVELLRILKK
jgi:hypothetical protein